MNAFRRLIDRQLLSVVQTKLMSVWFRELIFSHDQAGTSAGTCRHRTGSRSFPMVGVDGIGIDTRRM
jgi:hypothetical protein